MADDNKLPDLPPVAAQKGAKIGDENIPGPRDYEVDVNKDEAKVPAPGVAERATTVPVYEVVVVTDVATGPDHPQAVQVPDAGRGDALLPIHAHIGAKRVEEIFAEQASSESEVSDEDRAKASASGTTPESARGKKSDKS